MVVVRMVRVCNMSVEETADIQGRSPNRARNWLRRYDEGSLEGLWDIPRTSTRWKNAGTRESASCYTDAQKSLNRYPSQPQSF